MATKVAPDIPKSFLWTKASNEFKASYHCVTNGVSVSSKPKVRKLVDQFFESLTDAERRIVFWKGKSVIDLSVYGEGSQQFRLPWCSKYYPPSVDGYRPSRPLIPFIRLTENTYEQGLAQVLPEYSARHPPLPDDRPSPSKKVTPRKLTRYRVNANYGVKVSSMLPLLVAERLEELCGTGRLRSVSRLNDTTYRVLVSDCHDCLIKGSSHKHNNIFFDVKPQQDVIWQGCWNANCKSIYESERYERPNIRYIHPREADLFIADDF